MNGLAVPNLSPIAVEPRAAILIVGEDPYLMRTRQMVLEREGYTVTMVRGDEVFQMSPLWIDIAVLCHSLAESSRKRVVAHLQSQFPHVRIVLLDRLQRHWSKTEAGLSVSHPDPRSLLESIQSFL